MAFETTTELCEYVEKEIGHLTSSSSDRDDILSHLDRAHKMVCGGGGILNADEVGKRRHNEVNFVWAKSKFPLIITMTPPVEDKTLRVIQNSNSVTLANVYASSLADYHVRVSTDLEVYRVLSHTANTNAVVLDSSYVNSNANTATADFFKLVYPLGSSNVLSLISPIRCFSSEYGTQIIKIVDEEEMLDRYPLSDVDEGFPEYCGVIHESTGTLYLQFSHYPEDYERLEIPYVPVPSTLVEGTVNPILPRHHRLCLAHLACYFMLQRLDDDRANGHLKLARDLFDDLVNHNQNILIAGDPDFGRIIPCWNPNNYQHKYSVETDYE